VGERIWSLPGPRSLVTDALGELKAGRHVVIALPAKMAGDPAITDSLSDAVSNEAGRFTTARRLFAEPDLESPLEVVARAVDFDDPPATVPQLLSHPHGADTTFVMVVAEHTETQQAQFPKFLERLEQETRSVPTEGRMSLVVIGGRNTLPNFRGGESSDVSLATLWWWNRIARWDTAAHISHLAGPRIAERILADIRTETIVEVARWNLALAEQLAWDWSGDPAELPEHLGEPTRAGEQPSETRERCGVSPADELLDLWDASQLDGWHDHYSPAPSAQRLRRLVWAAQARIVLPWIEQRREVLQERTVAKIGRKNFNDALQFMFDPPLTDAGQVEIKDLYKIIAGRLGKTDPGMRSTAWRLRDSRNKAAHLEPLTLAELGELVNVCRDLY
jgi:hypothetical protein